MRVLLLLLAGLAAAAVQAASLIPGQHYRGGEYVVEASLGIGFTIPPGWSGLLPQGSEFFLMAPADQAGTIFVGADELSLAEARRSMSQELPLGEGITLHPASELRQDGRRLSASYRVSGTAQPLISRATTVLGERGLGIYFIAVFPQERVAEFGAAVESLVESIRWSAPVTPPPAPAAGAFDLAGKKLTRIYSGSGYSETQYLYLCRSGQFYHDFNGGGYGWNASGAFASNSRGHWQLQGRQLLLQYADGSSGRYDLAVDGSRFLMDGKRWFREDSDCH